MILISAVPFSRSRWTALFAAIVVIVAAGWVSTERAAASQVQPVTVDACVQVEGGGCALASSVRVDQAFGLKAAFRVNSTLSAGGVIYVRAPAGTVFRDSVRTHVNLGVGDSGYGVQSNLVQVTEGGRTVAVTLPGYVNPPATSNLDVSVNIGFFNDDIQVPPTPGSFSVEVWTSADTDGRTSGNSITTTLGLPAQLVTAGGGSSSKVTQEFPSAVSARVMDSRGNGLAGETVTFDLPEDPEAPGGTFPGEESTFTDTSNSQGYVTAPAITAGTVAGSWTVVADGPGTLSGNIVLINEPGTATSIEVSADPDVLPADGQSSTTAEIAVTDQFDNPIVDDELSIDTGGGPTATTPENIIGDVYESQLTASTAVGVFTITITDESTVLPVTGEFELEQTQLPPSTINLVLEPSSIPADGVSQTVAKVTVLNEIGNPVPGAVVKIESTGGQQIGTPAGGPNGAFTASVLSTTTPGVSTITASVADLDPELKTSAGLTQTQPVVPPPPPPLTQPVVKIKSGPKGKIKKKKVTFRFVVAKGAAIGFQCKLDGKKWSKCKSPKVLKVKPGKHVFQVRGVGGDGKPGKAVKRKFKRIG